jgi:hypothetical protein
MPYWRVSASRQIFELVLGIVTLNKTKYSLKVLSKLRRVCGISVVILLKSMGQVKSEAKCFV